MKELIVIIIVIVLVTLLTMNYEAARFGAELEYCSKLAEGREWLLITKGMFDEGTCRIAGEDYPIPENIP